MSREKHYGFSGTRHGMTDVQIRGLWRALVEGKPTHLHHGCCLGADEQAVILAFGMGLILVAHPPEDTRLMSMLAVGLSTVRHEKRPFLERDKAIVDQSMHLVAAPQYPEADDRSRRSGTWFTVRYARFEKQLRTVIQPSGDVTN